MWRVIKVAEHWDWSDQVKHLKRCTGEEFTQAYQEIAKDKFKKPIASQLFQYPFKDEQTYEAFIYYKDKHGNVNLNYQNE